MKIISEPNNQITFNSVPKKQIIKKTKQIAAIASGITMFNVSLNGNKRNNKVNQTVDEDYNLTMREALIKSKIQENIEKKKTISVKSIAKELNIPLHLVITSLYRTKSNIRTLFDKVKNTSYLKKPTSDNNKNAANDIINASNTFLTTGMGYNVEDKYISTLGRKLDNLEFSKEDTEELKNMFELKPGLVDAILFSRSKSKKSGAITPNTMKAIIAAHEINQELTEDLLCEKKSSGSSYALRDIYKIVKVNQMSEKLLESAKEDATTVYSLAMARMKNGKPRFGAEDILQILKSLKESPDFTNIAINQKDGFVGYRFNGHQLRLVLKTYEKYPYLVSSLVKSEQKMSPYLTEYKYSAFCIEKILDTLNSDDDKKIKMVIELLKYDDTKFPSTKILSAIEKYEESKD